MSNNTALVLLECTSNQLTSLDVSANISLLQLFCVANQLTSLDVSNNPNIDWLICSNNQLLTSLNIANGNNPAINLVDATMNPNLLCIQHDSGFTPYTTSNSLDGWHKDTTASWSTNCALGTAAFNQTAYVAYPNPVKDILNLEYNAAITNVRVYNLLGQEVINQNVNTTVSQIDMTKLSAGTYMVKVDTIVETIKVVKE